VLIKRLSIKLGTTEKSKKEVEELIESLGTQYKGTDYHLVFNNCNNFSNTLSNVR
jgi:deubiquitinase DESI2